MRSSSTDPDRRGRPFWPSGGGAWLRLALVVGLGSGAVVTPLLDRTGAMYTDRETVTFELDLPQLAPTESPAPEASETAVPTTEAPEPPAEEPDPTGVSAPDALTLAPSSTPTAEVPPGGSDPAASAGPTAEPTPGWSRWGGWSRTGDR